MMITLTLVALLIIANGAPMVLSRILGNRGYPIDGARRLSDGQPIFGVSKTWRGLLVAIGVSALAGWVLGLGAVFGACFGLLAMVGDLFSSFIKRRFGLLASDRARWLDQVPEALLPALLAHFWLAVGWGVVIAVTVLFAALNIWGSPLLHRWGIRHQPH